MYDNKRMNYKCQCKKQYSGYNCEFRNDSSKGVGVDLLNKDTNLPVIPVITKKYMFDKSLLEFTMLMPSSFFEFFK